MITEHVARPPAEDARQNRSEPSGYLVVVPSGSDYASDLVTGLVATLRRSWTWLVAGLVAGLAAGVTISLTMTPVYRAEVTAMVASHGSESGVLGRLPTQLAGLASLAGISNPTSNLQQEALAVLQSFQFTAQFIERHGLMQHLFEGESASRDGDTEEDDRPTLQDAFKLFDEDIRRVYVDEDANLIRIRIYWKDPGLAATWANALVSDLNDQLREAAISNAQRSIGFLQEQLAQNAPVEIREGIFDLIQAQLQKIMLASVEKDYALRIVDPAIVLDRDKYVRPAPMLYSVLGAFGGLVLAAGIVLWLRPAGGAAAKTKREMTS